jgi:hypothetical protein
MNTWLASRVPRSTVHKHVGLKSDAIEPCPHRRVQYVWLTVVKQRAAGLILAHCVDAKLLEADLPTYPLGTGVMFVWI